jgi:hypothetical protein
MAYIDPGTGSMIVQALIAGLLGAMFVIRKWIREFLTRLFGSGKKKGQDRGDA